MNFRLIEIQACQTCKEVLVARVRPDDAAHDTDDYVEIVAWHDEKDTLSCQRETVEFDDATLLNRFICDFSELSANEFANSFGLLNEKLQ